MAKLFSAPNLPAVQSTAAQSIQQGAQARAQMYSSLGQALGKVGSAYFEKKEEDKQIDAIVDNPEILDLVYRGQTDMPADPKERRKDVKALFKGLGGREGVENYLMRDRAEQRAASAEQRGVDALAMQQKKHDMEKKDLRLRNEVLMKAFSPTTYTEETEVGRTGGWTVGEMFPGLKPTEPSVTEPIRFEAGDLSSLPIEFQAQKGVAQPTAQAPQLGTLHTRRIQLMQQQGMEPEDIIYLYEKTPDWAAQAPAVRAHLGLPPAAGAPTAQPESTYASRLMGKVRGGIRTAREKLAKFEIPEIPFAKGKGERKGLAPYTTAMSMEGFINSMQESGLGKEHMPYILELAKTKPTASALGSTGIMDALRDNTYLSPAEAEQALVDTHRRLGMPRPGEAAIETWKKSADVQSGEDIKDSVMEDFKAYELDAKFEILEAMGKVNNLLVEAKTNPVARAGVVKAIAKLFDKGTLTKDDTVPFQGGSNFMERLEQAMESAVGTGRITTTNYGYLEGVIVAIQEDARDKMNKNLPEILGQASRRFNISQKRIMEITPLGDMMKTYNPPEPSDDVARQIQNAKPGDEINDPAMGPLVVLYRMLDGRTVVHPKGKPNETMTLPAPEGFVPDKEDLSKEETQVNPDLRSAPLRGSGYGF